MKDTIKNLTKAFIGESIARNRYTFYAKKAKKDGFEQIAEIFLKTADNEKEHAKWHLKMINELKKETNEDLGEIKVESEVTTIFGTTIENLKSVIAGENHESDIMYIEFADTAEKEGLHEIGKRLRAIAQAEKHHAERFKKLLNELEGNSVFKKNKKVYWVCRECGYPHYSEEAPKKCPSCGHPMNYFEISCEEY